MGRPARSILFTLASLSSVSLAACASSGSKGTGTGSATVESCRQEFSPDNGYGYESDLSMPVSPPGDAASPSVPSPLEQSATDCVADGASNCDTSQVLTHDAVLCIARGLRMAEGIAPWRAGLAYHYQFRRIIWSVENTLHSSSDGSSDGDVWAFDAQTGALIEKASWGATP